MIKKNACLLLVLLASLLGATPLAAQIDYFSGCTTTKDGDSFWRLANQNLTADQWKKLWEMNPQTPEGKARKVFIGENGWPYVWLGKGEKICGLGKVGIIPEIATSAELSAAGIKQEALVVEKTVETTVWWSWLLLGLLVLITLVLLALYFFFRRDPTRVGEGRVDEYGVHSPEQAADHVRRQLARHYGTTLPILSLVRGRGYGWAQVGDRIGAFFGRILNGEQMWEATVQLPNGQQEIRYTLLGCANDVRAGGGMMPGWGFRFVAEENVTAQIPPPTEPASAPVAPQPEPELVPTAAVATAQPEPAPAPVEVMTKPVAASINESGEFIRTKDAPAVEKDLLKIVYRPEENGKDSLVEAEGVDVERFTFTKNGNSITFRFREARTSEAKTELTKSN